MGDISISVENLGKQYRLGAVGGATLREDVGRLFSRITGKSDPALALGEMNDRSKAGVSDYVWALRHVDFEVKQGDVLGIVGANGAGKSTLLKLLSRLTAPTEGSIRTRGRMASLLEVGTGFHPELTGRENIFLNGAIMGMRRHEIKRKLDQIIDFSGVERYVDTPVKRYSSGMYVRLAFAVAAHLEPEILIVDEVLAVGDMEFQKKCLGKMQDVSSSEGKTILFVSHNMAFVNKLCNTCLFLKNGTLVAHDQTETIVKAYEQQNLLDEKQKVTGTGKMTLTSFQMRNAKGEPTEQIYLNQPLRFELNYDVHEPVNEVSFAVFFNDLSGQRVVSYWTKFIRQTFDFKPGNIQWTLDVPSFKLTPGHYEMGLYVDAGNEVLQNIDNFKKVLVSMDANEPMEVLPQSVHGAFLDPFQVRVNA
jgi:lipopolysaccharide transport system ATP-binding protein